ncbi:34550_t:CDS:2, partial [Gigaspora margarita]
GISTKIFEETQVINLFDKHQFKSLHRTLDSHMKSLVNDSDKNCKQSSLLEIDEIKFILNSSAVAVDNLKASWLKELDDSGMQLELTKEKNYTRGIKDLYVEFRSSLIPSDISENTYKPVADIRRYLSKQPNNIDDDYFFVFKNTSKNIYHSNCYLASKLRKELHDTMIHSIYNLVELDITLDEQIIFSCHKTFTGVFAY